jgi:perosamine synthetase
MVTGVWEKDFGISKEDMMDELEKEGISSRPFFYPLSSLPAYRELPQVQTAATENPIAYDLSARSINLPSGFNMTRDLAALVSKTLKRILLSRKRAG